MTITTDRVKAALEIVVAVGQAVREAGPLGIGSGVLYAPFAAHGYTVEAWDRIVGVLIKQKLVRKENHCLYWIGPV